MARGSRLANEGEGEALPFLFGAEEASDEPDGEEEESGGFCPEGGSGDESKEECASGVPTVADAVGGGP